MRSGYVLLGVLACTIALVREARAQAEFRRGDANGDGTTSVADSYFTLRFLFHRGAAPECLKSADFNDDGVIDISDPIGALNYHVLGGSAPCDPFPDPGSDRSDDGLDCESYGNGEPLSDAGARLEVVGAVVDDSGTVTITVVVANTTPVAGYAGTVDVGGDVIAGAQNATDLTGLAGDAPFRAARVFEDALEFGFIASLVEPVAIPPSTGQAVFEFSACVRPGTAPGDYALTLVAGELIDLASGRAIAAELVGGSINVPPGFAGGCAADVGTRSGDPTCESGGPNPDPDPEPQHCEDGLEFDFTRGDANADGRLSLSDSLMTRRFLFNGDLPPSCLDAADVNDDGVIDLSDVVFGLNAILLGGPSPDEPTGDPGKDPSADALCCDDASVVPAEATSDLIEIGDVEAVPGQLVEVPVFLTNSAEVEAYQLVLAYDPDVFVPEAITFAGTFYAQIDSQPGFRGLDPELAPGILAVGFIPNLVEEGFETPPGEHRLVFKLRGRVPATVAPGTEVELAPTNGPGGAGYGPFGLQNELTYQGQARFVSALPEGMPGRLKIVGDVTIFRGDANDDGAVDISDGVFTLNYLFLGGPPPACRDAADANDDGTIDLSDPVATLNALYLSAGTIAPPYPGRGPDPTADALPGCAAS